jgi:hypothetical protein
MAESTLRPPASQATNANQPVTLHGPWLVVVRVGWVLVALLTLTILIILATRGTRLLMLEREISDGYVALSRYLSYPAYTGLVLAARYVTLAAYLLTAGFIFWRKSADLMGLITSFMLLLLPLWFGLGGVVPDPSLTAYRQSLDLLLTWAWPLAFLGVIAVLMFLNLFPSGRFPARWAQRWFWLSLGLLLLLSTVGDLLGERGGELLGLPAGIILAGLLALCAAGQIYRYRRVSGPVERLQTRWVLGSLGLVVFWLLAIYGQVPFRSFEPLAVPWALFKVFGTVIVLILLPLTIARSILRYHLWDIDVIVRKALVYALLTGSLLLVYLASILFLQRLFTRLTGQDSTLATILSTLLIAALFLPLRRRIQAFIDRRFYRSKYDAAKVLEGFAATARDETNLDKLTAELLRVIQETMEPEHVSIWLRYTKYEIRDSKDE